VVNLRSCYPSKQSPHRRDIDGLTGDFGLLVTPQMRRQRALAAYAVARWRALAAACFGVPAYA